MIYVKYQEHKLLLVVEIIL